MAIASYLIHTPNSEHNPSIQPTSPLQKSFDAIVKKADEAKIKPDTAVQFVASLSEEERTTLQDYHDLYGSINPEKLSKEGAYNLLVPTQKRADLDGDGVVRVGEEQSIRFPPIDFPRDAGDTYVNALHKMRDQGASVQDLYSMSLSIFQTQMSSGMVDVIGGNSSQDAFGFLANRFENLRQDINSVSRAPKKLSLVNEMEKNIESQKATRGNGYDTDRVEIGTNQNDLYNTQMDAYALAAKRARTGRF